MQRSFGSALGTAVYLVGSIWMASAAHAGVMLGQVDDFQDGTVAHWSNGPAPDPRNIAGGGPGGAADRFMKIVATGGGGAGSRLIAYNRSQWTGNFAAAGVGAVAMDLLNFSTNPLPIRIAIKSATASGPGWATTNAYSLPADGQWHHAIFGLSASDMTAVDSPPSFTSTLSNVREFRILASAKPAVQGDPLAASLGVDNITAVPEPASLLAVATVGGVLALGRRR